MARAFGRVRATAQLVAPGVAAAADIDRLSTQMSGLQETIDQLREAVDGLQPNSRRPVEPPAVDPMVGPQLARVDELLPRAWSVARRALTV